MSCSLNRLVLFHGLRREIVYCNGSDLSSKVTLQYDTSVFKVKSTQRTFQTIEVNAMVLISINLVLCFDVHYLQFYLPIQTTRPYLDPK